MVPRKECAPELVAKARHLYEQTDAPVDDIAAMMGLTRSPFYHRVRECADMSFPANREFYSEFATPSLST